MQWWPLHLHWWPLKLTSNRGHQINVYLHGIPFLKQQRSPLPYPWYGVLKKVYQVGVNMHYLVWRSPKSAAEVTIVLSLVWDFQKGISCRGKYALFGLVWFGGHSNQLQRSPLQCPWSGVFKKGISCRGKFAVFGLVWRSPKSAAEVTIALSLVCHFQKGISWRGKYTLFGLPPIEVKFRGHAN